MEASKKEILEAALEKIFLRGYLPTMELTANEYQRESRKTAVYPHKSTLEAVNYLIHGLTGEAGEIANKFKKILRNQETHISEEKCLELMDELSDVLWYSAMLASDLGYSLEAVMAYNREKLSRRAAEGTLKERKQSKPTDFLSDEVAPVGHCSK